MESINTGVEFYSNVKASEVEWVWYPYIPCGKITMLQGDPGEGKSTLIIHVAAILTKGGYLPDGQKIKKPEMVIYQCSEDGKGDTIKPRLEQAGADCNRVAFIKDDNGELTLEESFQHYEEGMKLIRECHQSIDQVEKKLQVIQEGMSDAEDI